MKNTRDPTTAQPSHGIVASDTLRIVVLGSQSVGKSTLIRQWVSDGKATRVVQSNPRGVDMGEKIITDNDKRLNLKIFGLNTNAPDMERHHLNDMMDSQISDADFVVLVFDLTNKKSLNDLVSAVQESKNRAPNAEYILIGNKVDRHTARAVTEDDVDDFINNQFGYQVYYKIITTLNCQFITQIETCIWNEYNKKQLMESPIIPTSNLPAAQQLNNINHSQNLKNSSYPTQTPSSQSAYTRVSKKSEGNESHNAQSSLIRTEPPITIQPQNFDTLISIQSSQSSRSSRSQEIPLSHPLTQTYLPQSKQNLLLELDTFERGHADNKYVKNLVGLLKNGVTASNPQSYFSAKLEEIQSQFHRLQFTSKSLANTLANMIVTAFLALSVIGLPLAYFSGWLEKNKRATGSSLMFFAFGAKQEGQVLCHHVLEETSVQGLVI